MKMTSQQDFLSHILVGFMVLNLLGSCKSNNQMETGVFQTTLWSQQDSSYNNFRIPSMIVTKKGTVLAFAEGREGGDTGNIDLIMKRSLDNGKTWSDQIVIWDDGENTCGNPCVLVDQITGRILLFMTWNLGTDHEEGIIRKESKSTRIPYMCYSDDDGLSWSIPKKMFESAKNPEWGWYATGPGIGIQLQSESYRNRLVIPCNNSYDVQSSEEAVRGGFGYGAHVLISDDHGETWKMSELIRPAVNESQVVELKNGVLQMNMRSYHGKNRRAISYSYDGGETWSAVEHDSELTESVCQGSLLYFGEFENEPMYLFSNPAVAKGRSHMTIKTMFDETKNWSNSKLITPNPSAYSCLTSLPNGRIGLFFETGKKNPYEQMLFVSFQPKELNKKGALLDIN